MEQETHGYESLERVREQTTFLYNSGVLNYFGGFRQTSLGKESSRPEEMLEAAIILDADTGLVKKLRALVAAERIGLNPTKVESTVVLYGLDAEEKDHVAKILANYEENWCKSVDREAIISRIIRPNNPIVEEIRHSLSS